MKLQVCQHSTRAQQLAGKSGQSTFRDQLVTSFFFNHCIYNKLSITQQSLVLKYWQLWCRIVYTKAELYTRNNGKADHQRRGAHGALCGGCLGQVHSAAPSGTGVHSTQLAERHTRGKSLLEIKYAAFDSHLPNLCLICAKILLLVLC